ncbi:MAG: hypothetical protein OEU68_18670 [Nitrospira sp.]|nr:hypothetical protein [Nitrospira sp.]MDH5320171.1 hypothetical protein [Nitrospira sp.]
MALIDFGRPADALFGLTLSPDQTKAVAVGWKGVTDTESGPTTNDDGGVVLLSLPPIL